MDSPTIYCEFVSHGSEWVNTITNVAYFISAFFAYRLVRNSKNLLLQILPVLIVCIGIGSTVWHHSQSALGDMLDTLAIGLFASTLALLLLQKLTRVRWLQVVFFLVIAGLALWFETLPQLNGSLVYVYLFGLLVGALGYLSCKRTKLRTPTLVIGVVATLSVIARSVDMSICISFPLGTHFLWHVGMAVFVYVAVVSVSMLHAVHEHLPKR